MKMLKIKKKYINYIISVSFITTVFTGCGAKASGIGKDEVVLTAPTATETLATTTASTTREVITTTEKTTVATAKIITEAVTEFTEETTTYLFETETVKDSVEIIQGTALTSFKPYDDNDYPVSEIDFDGLPEGTAELFQKAVGVWDLYYVRSMLADVETAEKVEIPMENQSYIYYKTGISYASFVTYMESIFTADYLERFQRSNVTFIDYYGELLCLDVEGLANPDFNSIAFNITAKNDTKIELMGDVSYLASDGYAYKDELSETLVLTKDGWRLDEFNCWY